ncbi:alkaline phosphatase D family protein [Corynebacterium tapiri]|uniref:Phosphodiesterase n=1 Tax=Corynebacterium tapiri TaxID=1448266 RepID=A0A5C4U5W1_9CORY|nr:alkaline phosphatase D family protein [Corynebacterium tapiri]TNL99789.1 phosphodiesterase [Corynebacterium tapiri]
MTISRRSLLSSSAAAIFALTSVRGLGYAHAQSSSTGGAPAPVPPANMGTLPFIHGVASGDPYPESVILWTRVTPSRDALPGSGLGKAVELTWEIATDHGFGSIVGRGSASATAERDHCVHVEAKGLEPATEYFYRFRTADGALSPIGRTKTAPARGASVAELNYAISSCANWESGYFGAYEHMASANFDFIVGLGDFIYEYGTGEYAGKHGVVRTFQPTNEIVTFEDYCIRYGQYRTDPSLQKAQASAPWIVTWDDHEMANNAYRDGAENHTDGVVEGGWQERRQAAKKAFYLWQPLRPALEGFEAPIYRSFTFGNLAQLTMMDLRSFRDPETTPIQFADPGRTMLGEDQFAWVEREIGAAHTRWNMLGNSVMISPLKILTLQQHSSDPAVKDALAVMQQQATGIAVNSDQWDGYAHERDRLLKLLASSEAQTLFLTGDIHSEWAHSVVADGREIGCEIVCTSVSAPNIDDLLTSYTGIDHPQDNSTSQLVESLLKDANPWVKHIDFDAHGYTALKLTANQVQATYQRVANVADPSTPVTPGASVTWNAEGGFTG